MSEETTIKDWLPVLTAVVSALAAYWGYRAKSQSEKNAANIEVVHTAVNGLNADRLAEAKVASHAEGVIEGAANNPDPLKVELVEPAPVPVKIVEE